MIIRGLHRGTLVRIATIKVLENVPITKNKTKWIDATDFYFRSFDVLFMYNLSGVEFHSAYKWHRLHWLNTILFKFIHMFKLISI